MAVENDIVLLSFEDQPLIFARIESILPDTKPDWYHVKLLMLKMPLEVVTWILRDIYINGEAFTMNGKKMRLERIECPKDETTADAVKNKENKSVTIPKKGESGNVISLADLKKK